jgi:hypothetical protein
MIDQTLFHYQLECSRTAAIVYIGGRRCSAHHLHRISRLIGALPPTTRVLRVDLHGVISMDLQTLMDLRGILARWRTEHDANVRLVMRAPLPREEWPTNAIHFERPALRLVRPSRKADHLDMMRDRRIDSVANAGFGRLLSGSCVRVTSAGAP